MATKFSSYFYRNPAAQKKLEAQLRKELGEFKPVQNDPRAVLEEIRRIQQQIEDNSNSLNQAS